MHGQNKVLTYGQPIQVLLLNLRSMCIQCLRSKMVHNLDMHAAPLQGSRTYGT